MWSSPGTPSRYATLGGETLPLFQRSGSPHTPLVRVRDTPLRFGQRARLTPRLLLMGCGVASFIVLVNVLLWRLLAAHDETDADLTFSRREHELRAAGGPGFLAMSDDEALDAMYPRTAARVPRSHAGEPPASACEARFTLLLVADQDRATLRANGSWHSTLRRGSLCLRSPRGAAPSVSVSWVDEVPLTSPLNADGRGMELSELVWYAGRLLTCDDHTGVVYEVKGGRVVPAYILADGDGHAARSFKCEWAAVRHGLLYVGGLGRAWPEERGAVDAAGRPPRMHTGTPMWVKVLDGAAVRHANWAAHYAAMREAANVSGAGYLSHEAALWDDRTNRWLFMPRRLGRGAPHGTPHGTHAHRARAPRTRTRTRARARTARACGASRLAPCGAGPRQRRGARWRTSSVAPT